MPTDHGRIPQGAWIYASCRAAGLLAGAASGALVAAHPRLAPGRGASWEPPDPDVWQDWRRAMTGAGVDVTRWVVARPSDPRRARFNLLALDRTGRHSAFVKFKRAALDTRHVEALAAAGIGRLSFWAPALIAAGASGPWSFVATTPMPPGPHRPARLSPDARRRLVAEIRTVLPAATSPGWVPIHGDLGPWNVRTVGWNRLAVVDWEETTEGPDAADEVWHAATWHLIRGREPDWAASAVLREVGAGSAEAASFWLSRLDRPESGEIDEAEDRPSRVGRFEEAIKACLGHLAAGS